MSAAPVRVVIAAGGLGTRVADWAQLLPKEFQPVDGRPALLHILDEITAAGTADAVLVYHRYYEPFIAWVRQVLQPGGAAAYRALAGLPPEPAEGHERLRLRFVRQHGGYADITSVLNGAGHLPAGPLYVVFADNLYPADNALAILGDAPAEEAAVLARPFDPEQASHRGVIVTAGSGRRDLMAAMVEKPEPDQVADLLTRFGPDRLRLLEGRFRISADLLARLRRSPQRATPGEPRLSVELAAYGRTRPVHVITTESPVIDLGRRTDRPLHSAKALPSATLQLAQ
jgi:UTP-glucose-1-phosphate uridylyltransferase